MSKLTEQADGIYSQATQDRNTAQGLTDQATSPRASTSSADKAQTALADANDGRPGRAATPSPRSRRTRRGSRPSSRRLKTERRPHRGRVPEGRRGVREAAAAAAAARSRAAGRRHRVRLRLRAGPRPAGGYISSGFGMRVNPVTHAYILHAGTDLGAGLRLDRSTPRPRARSSTPAGTAATATSC